MIGWGPREMKNVLEFLRVFDAKRRQSVEKSNNLNHVPNAEAFWCLSQAFPLCPRVGLLIMDEKAGSIKSRKKAGNWYVQSYYG